jgi:hypothetical protein
MNDIYDGGGLRLIHDEGSDIKWMSYLEISDARGISVASAKRLTLRRKWRRQAGNDGTARVAVPNSELTPRAKTSKNFVAADAARIIETLETAVSALREQLERERDRADQAIDATAQAATRLAEAEAQNADLKSAVQFASMRRESLERALTAQEALNADLDLALGVEQAAREKAEADATALRETEAARRKLGRMTLMRKAWQGQ